MALFDPILALLERIFAPILRPIKPLVTLFTHLRDSTTGILDAATNLIANVETEYQAIRDFKSKPAWKNRVISVPRALDNITELAQVPSRVLGAFRDLTEQLKSRLGPNQFNLDELEGIEDLRKFGTRIGTKFAQGLEKILGAIGIIVDALVTIRATIDDLETIVDAVRTVRMDIENLDGVFLPQNNPRKTLKTLDGESFKIRVGSLHS